MENIYVTRAAKRRNLKYCNKHARNRRGKREDEERDEEHIGGIVEERRERLQEEGEVKRRSTLYKRGRTDKRRVQ